MILKLKSVKINNYFNNYKKKQNKQILKGMARNWMEINQPVNGCAERNGGKHA